LGVSKPTDEQNIGRLVAPRIHLLFSHRLTESSTVMP
jgi:hypothetical protein